MEFPMQKNAELGSSNFPIFSDEEDEDQCKTNAYGKMMFPGGKRRPKYIRFAANVDMEMVSYLMEEGMNLKPLPKIMISIVGSMKKHSFPRKMESLLQKELGQFCSKIKQVEQSTWFITDGTSTALINILGDALMGNRHININVIGVTSWELLIDRHKLLQTKDKISIPVYPMLTQSRIARPPVLTERRKHYLSETHTHFFLIDTDDQEDLLIDKMQTSKQELKFRAKLEKFLFDKMEKEDNEGLPITAQILIHGNLKAMKQIKKNLLESPTMPLFIIANSGGAADWMTWACKNISSELEDEKITEEFLKRFEKTYANNVDAKCDAAKLCVDLKKLVTEKGDYITIVELNEDNSSKAPTNNSIINNIPTYYNLEMAILCHYLNSNRENAEPLLAGNELCQKRHINFEEIEMLMVWHRPTIVEELLSKYIEDINIGDAEEKEVLLNMFAMRSLSQQSNKFIHIALRLGFGMQSVDQRMLRQLYFQEYTNEKDDNSNMTLLFLPTDDREEKHLSENLSEVRHYLNRLMEIKIADHYKHNYIDNPFKDLYLWSILCVKQEKAVFFWHRGETPLAKALIGRLLLLKIADLYQQNHPYFDGKIHQKILDNAQSFSERAVNFLDACGNEDLEMTQKLLTTPLPQWANQTCIELAAKSEFVNFIGNTHSERATHREWQSNKSKLMFSYTTLNIMMLVGIIFPVAILFFPFDNSIRHKKKCCRLRKKSYWWWIKCRVNSCWDKFNAFSVTPFTKFWLDYISYLFFLGCYAYVLLNKLEYMKPSIPEHLVLCYFVMRGISEIRKILRSEGTNVFHKFKSRLKNQWTILLFVNITLLHIAYALRISSRDTFPQTKFLYAISFFLFCMRLLVVISFHKKMGVYVVMIFAMVTDIVYFIIIMTVFVCAFAFARFSILYQNSIVTFTNTTEKDVIRKLLVVPFFEVLGDSFLTVPAAEGRTVFGTKYYDSQSGWFVLFLTFFFLVLMDIVFINLLIAVFNNTYETLQADSELIWKWQFYKLVQEFKIASFLPPPFSVLIDIWYLFKYLLCERRKSNHDNDHVSPEGNSMTQYFQMDNDFHEVLEFENNCLSIFERKCTDEHD